MSAHILKVKHAGPKAACRPCISFISNRLYGTGFAPGTHFEALSLPNGIDLRIRGGEGKAPGLLRVWQHSSRGVQYPKLCIQGAPLHDSGFSIGDTVIMQNEYGLVRIRKIPGGQKIVYISDRTVKNTGLWAPGSRILGDGLDGFGFVPEAVWLAAFENGSATFRLWEGGAKEYGDMVKYARQNRMKLLQVKAYRSRGKLRTFIELEEAWVAKTGFAKGEPLFADCRQGFIKLQEPGLSGLGF